MNLTMTADEVKLAMRIIGLRGTRMKATKNKWRIRYDKDRDDIVSLSDKAHVEWVGGKLDGHWMLTKQGIQQLKQQIGEFRF